MDLYIRSTSRRNFLKMRFLTIMPGSNFYKKEEWEYKGYTIANCSENGQYEILGTYETEERALEVLDEIQNHIENIGKTLITDNDFKYYGNVYEMPKE